MEAFERVLSGIPSLDSILDNIRLGDNVVFQVSSLEDFSFFVRPYVKQAIRDHRDLVYIRFSSNEPFVSPDEATIYELDPEEGFEPFTVRVHNIVTEHGRGAFYVFDCLSDLQTAWAADLMMGNFFRLTCPYLFQLDTVAFFPVLRGMHSHDALARIQTTTQLFLDVYSTGEDIYLHPVKVWNRYSPSMFMPHLASQKDGEFRMLSDAVEVSRYYAVAASADTGEDLDLDSWERYFQRCRTAPPVYDNQICTKLCQMMMTGSSKMSALFGKYFTKDDYLRVHDRIIGSGRIGGKSVGMLLARKIVEHELPDLSTRTEAHDSFFIGDHVFYTFLVENDLWDLRIAQKSDEGYRMLAELMRKGILAGHFPDDVREMFRRMLDYFGQSPIIARSSSLLEDGFGNAFAGKYESVFCVNQGSPEERLAAFEKAVKTVYASTMSASALEYRETRGLKNADEQMSVLVQRVSGSLRGDLFYPSAAGVGYSYDPYIFDRRVDPAQGMIRLVAGLGTRAVDRTETDYPRIVHLDRPEQSTMTSEAERARFSQHYLDVLDLRQNVITSRPLADVMAEAPYWYSNAVCDHDHEAEQRIREAGRKGTVLFGTCRGIVKNESFLNDVKQMLRALNDAYGYPVDIEFTVNLAQDGSYVICLLQCRPLQVLQQSGEVTMPAREDIDLVFASTDTSMGISQRTHIDGVVLIDAAGYHALPYREKSGVERVVAQINDHYRGSGKTMLLITPGRVGTSSPDLGVPLVFSELSQFSGVIEYDDAKTGFLPELSFGSHMFQDLVESGIFYTALFSSENKSEFNRDILRERGKHVEDIDIDDQFKPIVQVLDVSDAGLTLAYNMLSGQVLCGFEH